MHQATGAIGGYAICACRIDGIHFVSEYVGGEFRVVEGEGSSEAAASVRPRHFNEIEAGGTKELAWLSVSRKVTLQVA